VTRGRYSWPVDLWALGCVLYELLTLQRPWNTKSFAGLSAAILSCDVRHELLTATHHTTALKQLLTAEHHRLLHVDPAERINLAQLREALTAMRPALATEAVAGVRRASTEAVAEGPPAETEDKSEAGAANAA
jgi:serine/threonine protein kinase